MDVCVQQSMHVEVKFLKISLFLPPRESQGTNSGCQGAWLQGSPSAEPSCQPILLFSRMLVVHYSELKSILGPVLWNITADGSGNTWAHPFTFHPYS